MSEHTLEGDRALLDGFRRGERAALRAVFDRYVDDVARTVRAGVRVTTESGVVRLGDDLPEPEVEALVQETFAKAFAPKARDSYDGVRPFGAWIGTIARNLVVDAGRRRVKEGERVVHALDLDALPPDADAAPPNAEWAQEAKELVGLLEAFGADLDEPEASIFRLRCAEQRSCREVAEALSLTEIQVRRRDTRLRAALLDYLRARGFVENARVRIGASLLSRRRKG